MRVQEGPRQEIINAIPRDMYQRPSNQILSHLRSAGVIGVHGEEMKKIKSWLARMRKQASRIEPALRNSFGELLQIALHHSKDALKGRQAFHNHAVYTLGGAEATPPTADELAAWTTATDQRKAAATVEAGSSKLSSQVCKELKKLEKEGQPKGHVRIVFSTENLLLNAYRQQCSGMPAVLCVDYTHRLVFEKYNVCVMGTVEQTQHFHLIALAMTSDELARVRRRTSRFSRV